jgi:MYXO-CTERM domain-containing protein
MAANRARSDPSMVKGAMSTVYPAVKPLVLEYDLEQSSRFHAVNLDDAGVTLMHTSPCTLNTNVATTGCTGVGSCACATPVPAMCEGCNSDAGAINTCGTDPFTRIRYFYPAGNAEVAAAGYSDPWSLMDGWVDEAAGEDGHRTIIDSVGGDEGVAGFGHAGGDGQCFRGLFDVGDLGPSTTAPPMIASAAPMPYAAMAAGAFTIYATWNDPVGGAPADLNAVIDGACSPMTLELGTPTLNATYLTAAVTLAVGCHSVFIVGDSAGGVRSIYPTTTAFTINVGGGTCADEMPQPTTTCPGVDGGVGGADAGTGTNTATSSGTGTGTASGTATNISSGTGTGTGTGTSLDTGTGSDDGGGGDKEKSGSSSGCACGVAPSTGTTGGWGALAAGGFVLTLRRRRRTGGREGGR